MKKEGKEKDTDPNTGKFSQSFLYITFKNLIVISFYQLIGYLVMYTLQFDQNQIKTRLVDQNIYLNNI